MADQLKAGESLQVGQELRSANGRFILLMQTDGNLVLYDGVVAAGRALWATDTWNLPTSMRPTHADMQADGNLVLYTAQMVPIWATATDQSGATHLLVQNDGNVALYDDNALQKWATNTIVGEGRPDIIIREETEEVGWAKKMITKASLYRNGVLTVETRTQCSAPFSGLRGRVMIVCSDSRGRAIWVSREMQCATRCALFDPSCPSFGKETFTDSVPAVVSEMITQLDVIQADTASFVNLRDSIIAAIEDIRDIGVAGLEAIKTIYKGAEAITGMPS